MNKEITIYELLGLIIDDKEPKKIKHRDLEYKYSYKYKDYENVKEKLLFADVCAIKTSLNDKVEILEEDKDIEEMENYPDVLDWKEEYGLDRALKEQSEFNEIVFYRLNELAKEVNKLRKDR